ncbi:MAG: response regulator transcription factor [Anaerolineae bacterium]|nr:MAG: response regulator transcription factor [Anaerolineae bacterium]
MSYYPPISILVVEDDGELRASVVAILELQADMKVLGQAANGQDAFNLCRYLHPQIVLMDIVMPVMNGITATHLIHDYDPEIRVLVFSNSDQSLVDEALMAGAVGQVSKTGNVEKMLDDIREAAHQML